MEPFPRKRAIIIGADQYEWKLPALKYCGNDAREIARVFRSSLSFNPADILEFTAHSDNPPKRQTILHDCRKNAIFLIGLIASVMWFQQLPASGRSDNSVFVRAGRLRVRSVNSSGEHFPQRTINWEVGLCVREIRSWY